MSHPIENIMHSSMQHIKSLADVNTVIGDPLVTEDNTVILPVSKVSLGLVVGGGEYLAVSSCKREKAMQEFAGEYPFIGASTVGMSLTPLAFLAVQDGGVRVLPAKQENPCERLIDLIPQMIQTAEKLISGGKCAPSCRDAKVNSKLNGVEGSEGEAVRAARCAEDRADKAQRAADKARSAAERAYDSAVEASRAAGEKAAERKNAEEGVKAQDRGGSNDGNA